MTMREKRPYLRFLFVCVTLLAIAAQTGAARSNGPQSKGIFRISLAPQAGLDYIDPALSYTPPGWALIDTTCARLMAYPDKPPPAGFRAVPEVALAFPKVSRDLKTFTFTLRSGFRFSDGTPVHANAFARAINRTLAPAMDSPGVVHVRDIVGADDVLAGRRANARGVVAHGNTLVVRFVRPAPDFPTRTTLPFFCAVPPTLPIDPEGVRALPGAGPYYVSEYRPLERVVIRRNRFYRGNRPYHVDGFDVDLRAASPQEMVQRIERGEADWGYNLAGVFLDPSLGLVTKYGVNRSRFYLKPGLTMRMLALNSSRPLFRKNPQLRKAVNFALDRQALQDIGGGPQSGDPHRPVPPVGRTGVQRRPRVPACRRRRRRELAPSPSGNLRGGKAVLYTTDVLPAAGRRSAREAAARRDRARGGREGASRPHRDTPPT